MPDRVAEISFGDETFVFVNDGVDEMLNCPLPEDGPGEAAERLYRLCKRSDAARQIPTPDR